MEKKICSFIPVAVFLVMAVNGLINDDGLVASIVEKGIDFIRRVTGDPY